MQRIALILALLLLPALALGTTVSSSSLHLQGALTNNGDGTYTGVVPVTSGSVFDLFALEGGTAMFGNDPGSGPVWTSQAIGADHDAWPTWNPDTPDWYQYSVAFYDDGGTQKWALRNHPGATAANPWYDEAFWGVGGIPAMGVPMSGTMDWTTGYATETDTGAYLPATGTAEIPGGAAANGGGAGAWDMDWSWGSEVVPLQFAGFAVSVWFNGVDYKVTMTPAPALAVDPDWAAIVIRNNSTEGPPLIFGNGLHGVMGAPEFAVFAGSQKAALATDKINGVHVSDITTLHTDRLDDVVSSGSLWGPYFNIWITDGAGNYAVIANEPSDGEWTDHRWDVSDWDFLKTKRCKVYETAGWNTLNSWVHTYAMAHGWDGVSDMIFENVGGLVIEPPSPAYIAASSDIGSGAPDELGTNIARGFNWMFGDTAANYVTGAGEGFVVANFSATAHFPFNNTTQVKGYGTLTGAVADAYSGDTIVADPGTYVVSGQVVIDKSLTIEGDPLDRAVLMTDSDTGTSGDARGWFLQLAGTHLVMRDLELDGAGHLVYQGIRALGNGDMENCALRNIQYQAGGPTYGGVAIAAFGGDYWNVTGCTFDDIGRIGILNWSGGTFSNNIYTGKGPGNWLDYAVDTEAVMIMENNTITKCRGVASSDGSISAAILVSTYYQPGTNVTLTGNTLTGNTDGVACGFDGADASVVVGRGNNLSGNSGYGVSNTSSTNSIDFLDNWWGDASGPFHDPLNLSGTGVPVDDNILFEPWSGMGSTTVVPDVSGPYACGQTHTLVFNLKTDIYTPDVFGFNAVVRATSEVNWVAVHSLAPFGGTTQFLSFNNGDGSWMISGTTQGSPTEPIGGAAVTPLFSIDFLTAGDGTADITFDSFTLRDPNNAPIPSTATGATILVDCTPPEPVTGITATPGHNKVGVDWTHPGTGTARYMVYRGLWHNGTVGVSAYPEYDDVAAATPTIRPASPSAADLDPEWVLADTVSVGTTALTDVGHVAGSGVFDPNGLNRGVYSYEVFAVDAAGNISPPAAANDRSTNYWLGDVTGIGPSVVPDGLVNSSDITDLGAAFGTTGASGTPPYNNTVDVGPTDDWSRLGIPTTDSRIDFEDLMVFSMNFGVVSAAKDKAPVATTATLAWVHNDDGSLALRLVDGSGLKGLRVTADHAVTSVSAGLLLDDQSELTFLRNVGENLDASVAVMGVNNGFVGEGDLMVIRSDEPVAMADLKITARGMDNIDLKVKLSETSGSVTPRVFALKDNYPNPFNPMTKISFSLPEAQYVKLVIYGVDGKRVATLIDGQQTSGLHEVVWMGRNDSGSSVASGTYFYQIQAGPYSQVKKMTLVK